MEFANFAEIRVSLRRHYDFARSTAQICDTLSNSDHDFAKASYETSVRRACGQRRADENEILNENHHRAQARRACDERAGNGAQTRTKFYMKTITAHWPEWRATPCGQRRADENEI